MQRFGVIGNIPYRGLRSNRNALTHLNPQNIFTSRLALDLFDVQTEPHKHEADDDQADAQADTAIVAFNHGVFACFAICHGDLHSRLDILFDETGLEAMDCDARFSECVARLILIETSFTHFHSSRFGDTKCGVCSRDRVIESVEIREDGGACAIAVVARSVTTHTHTIFSGAEHDVRWLVYAVVCVTHNATRQTLILKYLAVRALCVHLSLEYVAVGANVLHLIYTWRCRAVIAMAGCTGGCA